MGILYRGDSLFGSIIDAINKYDSKESDNQTNFPDIDEILKSCTQAQRNYINENDFESLIYEYTDSGEFKSGHEIILSINELSKELEIGTGYDVDSNIHEIRRYYNTFYKDRLLLIGRSIAKYILANTDNLLLRYGTTSSEEILLDKTLEDLIDNYHIMYESDTVRSVIEESLGKGVMYEEVLDKWFSLDRITEEVYRNNIIKNIKEEIIKWKIKE